jgi:putative zinc finger/helix-turn-helix YgiT family protein
MESTDTRAVASAAKERCTLCGAEAATRTVKSQQFAYRDGASNVLLVAEIPVVSCTACGETYTDVGAEEAQHEAVCRHLGRLTPAEIKELRERNGFSQAKLAEITGIGIASIKRWESGSLIQNASLDARLRSVDARVEQVARARPTPRFRTELPPEAFADQLVFVLRPRSQVRAVGLA